ncbi:MAG: hypothetical protein WCD20_15665 [Rhodomicrobium sp.]
MTPNFRLGSPIYYVPKCDTGLAGYIPVTRVHAALRRPLLTLGNQLVIAPKLTPAGMVASDKGGSFWISKEAFEASPASAAMQTNS